MSSITPTPQAGEPAKQIDCLLPAANTIGESLAARAAGGQGEGSTFAKLGYLFCSHCDWSGFSDELEADCSIGFEGGLCPECFSHCVEQA
jgi:hypothetical protein